MRENRRMTTNPSDLSDDPAADQGVQAGHNVAQTADEIDEVATVVETEVRVQRSPRYGRFMVLGGVIFAIVAFVLTFTTPPDAQYSQGAVLGFTLAICVTVGVTLGALAALLADRLVRRRTRTVRADRIDVRSAEDDPEISLRSDDT